MRVRRTAAPQVAAAPTGARGGGIRYHLAIATQVRQISPSTPTPDDGRGVIALLELEQGWIAAWTVRDGAWADVGPFASRGAALEAAAREIDERVRCRA